MGAPGRSNLRLSDSRQGSQPSNGTGRTHRAILSQGSELQMQYSKAMALGGIAHGPADNQDGVANVALPAADLSKAN